MDYKRKQTETDAGRRKLVLGFLGLGGLGILASVVSLVKSVVPTKSAKGGYLSTVAAGDRLVYADGDKKDQVVRIDDIKIGDGFLAYPQNKGDNQANLVLVVRLHPEDFLPPTHSEWTVSGLAVYSALCTHLSCTVSWDKKAQLDGSEIQCFCHNSVFEPRRGAKVLAGPAPSPLTQLPVTVNAQDELTVQGAFDGPIGPQV